MVSLALETSWGSPLEITYLKPAMVTISSAMAPSIENSMFRAVFIAAAEFDGLLRSVQLPGNEQRFTLVELEEQEQGGLVCATFSNLSPRDSDCAEVEAARPNISVSPKINNSTSTGSLCRLFGDWVLNLATLQPLFSATKGKTNVIHKSSSYCANY